jgi:UDP-galactose transporter
MGSSPANQVAMKALKFAPNGGSQIPMKATALFPISPSVSPKSQASDPELDVIIDEGVEEKEAWLKYRRLLVTALLTVQVAAMVLALRYSKTSTHYLSSTAVVCSELVKIIVCLAVLACQHGSNLPAHIRAEIISKPRDMIAVSVPALLYLLQNNLLFYAMERLDAALYQVTYQVKTLTTAICSVVILKQSISKQQWSSLVILTGGVALAQFQPHSSQTGQAIADEQTKGIFALLLACFTSGFAGVYTEKLLKQTTASLWVRNIQLGLWSIVVGIGAVYTTDGVEVRLKGFFFGYTWAVWLVVLLQGATGICVALVIKFADNIVKNFSVALSLLLATVTSIPLFGFYPSGLFVVGAALVLCSVVLYSIPDATRLVPTWLLVFISGARSKVAHTAVNIDDVCAKPIGAMQKTVDV